MALWLKSHLWLQCHRSQGDLKDATQADPDGLLSCHSPPGLHSLVITDTCHSFLSWAFAHAVPQSETLILASPLFFAHQFLFVKTQRRPFSLAAHEDGGLLRPFSAVYATPYKHKAWHRADTE